ncbi:SusC/RagA family TonB-linked outer membrane protein [Bacteroides bouchesdurhonensis]|uniref:SusC/RagA family TonB-linked outer membrane protein n=1 Tax=Bacteroides bouchesdurhonensis TaxID=1841855 RepID=UPI0011DCFFCF|nr:TonB-dependent receptor [Bacteroides bouchesdurhonensis]
MEHSKNTKKEPVGILKLFLLLLCMAGTSVFNQVLAATDQEPLKVTGVVFDELDTPLPGATVQVDKSTKGVITDLDGKFEIEVLPTDKLLISYVGYETKLVTIGDKKSLVVKLETKANELQDVTVVAFGKQKKESMTSAIETINPKELKLPTGNLTAALAGRLAGVISYQKSGEPGKDNAEFFVRGVTTFGYSSSPLILLDGFEISANDLARIQPDNIEQFSILKDATAAALYGSKGANGVIMVTTKKGKEGKPRVSFRHESRFSTPTKIPETVDGVTYMKLYNEAQFNDNPLLPPYYEAQKIQNTINGVNPYAYPNVDWYDELFKNFTYNQYYYLNVSGGSKDIQYYLAAAYTNETGILKNEKKNNFQNNINIGTYDVTAKVNLQLTKTTSFEVNMNSRFQNYTGPSVEANDIFNRVMDANPVEFPKYYLTDEEHRYDEHVLFGMNPRNSMANPYADMVKGYKDGFSSNILSQFSFNQKLDFLTNGLAFHAKVSIKTDSSHDSNRSYNPYFYNIKDYDELSNIYSLSQIAEGTKVLGDPANTRTANSHFYFETGLSYANVLNEDHELGAVLVYTQEENKNTAAEGSIQVTLPQRNQAIRARANYAYKSKYMAEASVTYNGSEKFDADHRWGVFPAMGVGYMISNEDFWQPLSEVMEKFKIRYSYGLVGNDNISDPRDRFYFLSDIKREGGYTWGKDFLTSYSGLKVNRYANPEITWEIARKQNLGVEVNLWRMLDIQLDYFMEKREKVYEKRAHIPATMGIINDIWGNVGEVKSWGWDGSADLNYVINKDAWVTGRFNFTYAKNKVTEREEPAYRDEYLRTIGWPVRQQWGLIAERLFIDEYDVANSPVQNLGTKAQAGDIKYKDINNDGIINDNDKVPIGYPSVPELSYGFGLSAGYKNWDISFFFQGQGHSSFFIDPYKISPFRNYRNVVSYIADDHWSQNNPVSHAFWPRLSTQDNSNNYKKESTWWLRDGRYLRLKNVELGYSLPKHALRKVGLGNVRFYFTGLNLLCFSSFDLWDPEMGDNGLGYPLQRVYNVGVQFDF